MVQVKALVVGISGCSSSGKTTLARLLRDILPNTSILHQDDFYQPENELPLKDGLVDWDCPEAIDIPALSSALTYIRQNACLPPTLESKEDRNSVGKSPVRPSTLNRLQSGISSFLPPSHPLRHGKLRIFLLDGFLLYPPSMAEVRRQLDLKIFLRASREKAKARREARDGYVTLEGFWADPPGYVDKVVWPNYVAQHAWMFEGGDVQGKLDQEALDREGVRVPPGERVDGHMDTILEWTLQQILGAMEKYNRARYSLVI